MKTAFKNQNTHHFSLPLRILVLILFFFCSALAIGWLSQTPSQEEMYSDVARFLFELKSNIFSQKGFSWWSSNFLQGHSMATYAPCLLPFSIGIVCTELFGDPAGIKVAALLVLPLAALTMFLFVRKLTKSEWTAFIAAILYISSASMLTRLANFEHWAGSYSYIFPPLIFWSFLNISEERSLRASSLLALSWAGMMLSYTKLTFMFLPFAGLFFLWLFLDQPKYRWSLLQGTLIALVMVFFLAGIFLLPLEREYHWVAAFHFDSFSDWQRAFCLKNIISILDRGNALLTGMPPMFLADRGQFYIGIVALAGIGLILWRTWRSAWLETRDGILLRLFLALTLASIWLSHGPFSPFTGLLTFIRSANNAQAWVIPLFWLMALLPPLLFHIIIPKSHHHRFWVILATFFYFFVPGFLVLEKLPLFHDIRAPWGFWEVGFFAISVTAALALSHLIFSIIPQRFRAATIILLSLILLADSSLYIEKFFAPGLPEQTFSDFDLGQKYLKESPIPGRVYPLSGRYFYLRTPMQSGRGITSEASWNHFQMYGVRALLNAANTSPQAFQTYLCIAGVSHILEDKQDLFTPNETKNFMTQIGPIGFDSDFIRIIENRNSLAPAFLARDYIAIEGDSAGITPGMLEAAAKFNLLSVELPINERHFPYLAGFGSPKNGIQLSRQYSSAKGAPFQRIPFSTPRTNASSMNFFFPTPQQGWLVVTEAWHPDWVAMAGEERLPIYRAFSGLIAVPLNNVGSIQFTFSPPFWYNWCVMIGFFSWLALLSFMIFMFTSKLPSSWKDCWTKPMPFFLKRSASKS